MKILMPLQRSWSPLLALDMVKWHDNVVFGDLMKSWNLLKIFIPLLALDVVKSPTHILA